MFLRLALRLVLACSFTGYLLAAAPPPLRVVIIGLTHGHVNGMLRVHDGSDFTILGVHETDRAVAAKYRERYEFRPEQMHTDLGAMLDQLKPEAAWVFTDTFAHLAVVEACAPRGIHVMVEKPLAVSLEHARRMAALARQHRIHLLTNLETTWYPSLHEARRLAVTERALGPITKIVGHFGHNGPAEIKVPPEFLAWLTDPRLNGGGASADFGCYGANLATWLLGNRRPLAVTAVFQTNKPAIYPRVDDESTVVLEYPGAQVIIQGSWDWPFARKDVEIYGRQGALRTQNEISYDLQTERRATPTVKRAAPLAAPLRNPVEYFAAVVRGTHDPAGDLSSLENNLIATAILDAARESARTGRRIALPAAD